MSLHLVFSEHIVKIFYWHLIEIKSQKIIYLQSAAKMTMLPCEERGMYVMKQD